VLNTVEHAADRLPGEVRWMLVGALAVAVLTVAALSRTLEVRRAGQHRAYRTAELALLASAASILLVGVTDWGAKATLASLVVLLLAPVRLGLRVWLRQDPAVAH
jgi:hypothetical protein